VSRELRALLLDFDGTVAETERYGHRVAYNQAFAEMKLDWRWDEELYGSLLSVTGGKERLRHYLERYRPELLDNVVSSGLVEKIHRDSNAGFRAALAAGLTTLVTVSDYTAEDDFAGASAVVSNLGEVNAPACSLSGPKPPNGIVDLAFLQALLNSAGESDTGRGYRPCVRQACSSE
jgi:phosphoglycolate phosphatase-like HAD superfamily hydrolase